jgi:hypothetical protein
MSESCEVKITPADLRRAESILKNAVREGWAAVATYEPRRPFSTSRLGSLYEGILDRVIRNRCAKILEAAQITPRFINFQEELRAQKKHVRAEMKVERLSARTQLAKELLQARARLSALRSRITALQFCETTAEANNKYPSPPAPTVRAHKDGVGLPSGSGIYFLWNEGQIAYVGQSICLIKRLRLGNHHAMIDGDEISYVEMEREKLTWAECFYLGALSPPRNFGGSASHHRYSAPPPASIAAQ